MNLVRSAFEDKEVTERAVEMESAVGFDTLHVR